MTYDLPREAGQWRWGPCLSLIPSPSRTLEKISRQDPNLLELGSGRLGEKTDMDVLPSVPTAVLY